MLAEHVEAFAGAERARRPIFHAVESQLDLVLQRSIFVDGRFEYCRELEDGMKFE